MQMRSCALSILVCVLGACAQQEVAYHARETILDRWERSRRDVEVSSGDLADAIRVPILTRLARIMAVLPEKDRQAISQIEVEILNAPTSMFIFESGYFIDHQTRRAIIRTSSETIATLGKIAFAMQICSLASDPDRWLGQYLLYIRAMPDSELIVDPLRASGVINEKGEIAEAVDAVRLKEAERLAKLKFDEMLTFLLAHEVAHLARPRASKSVSETEAAYLARVRRDEARADRVALDMLASVEESQREPSGGRLPLYLIGAPELFIHWIITMQGRRHSLSPSTHPLDHVRAKAVLSQIEGMLKSLPIPAEEKVELGNIIASSKALVSDIDTIGPAQHAAFLDEEAKGVTLEKLRFIR